MNWKLKTAVVAVLILAMGALLLWLAPVMDPVKDGDSASFWYAACGVDIVGDYDFRPYETGSLSVRNGWFGYYHYGISVGVYRVPASVALADFPKVVRKLETAPPGTLLPRAEKGFQEWSQGDPSQKDAPDLLAKIQRAELEMVQERSPPAVPYWSPREGFEREWERAQRYALNELLEFLFLAGLIVFAAWPWLRNANRRTWAIHHALLLWLLFLPYFLGYAPFTFSSHGPTGGVLYPWVIVWSSVVPQNPLDPVLMTAFPPVLEPLSAVPGPRMPLSGSGIGPCTVAGMAAALGMAVYGIGCLIERYCFPRIASPSENGEPAT